MRAVTRWAIAIAALVVPAGAVAPAAAATLVVATDEDPDSLDPALAYAPEAWQVLANCGEGLVAFRREAGAEGQGHALADIRPGEQLGQHEHQGRRRHVAEAGEHVIGVADSIVLHLGRQDESLIEMRSG